MELTEEKLKKLVIEIVKNRESGKAFTERRITDTPTDAYSPVNRRFVTLSSTIGSRPVSSVAVVGQHFFPTDTNIPMVFDGNDWRNGVGSVVALGRNS